MQPALRHPPHACTTTASTVRAREPALAHGKCCMQYVCHCSCDKGARTNQQTSEYGLHPLDGNTLRTLHSKTAQNMHRIVRYSSLQSTTMSEVCGLRRCAGRQQRYDQQNDHQCSAEGHSQAPDSRCATRRASNGTNVTKTAHGSAVQVFKRLHGGLHRPEARLYR